MEDRGNKTIAGKTYVDPDGNKYDAKDHDEGTLMVPQDGRKAHLLVKKGGTLHKFDPAGDHERMADHHSFKEYDPNDDTGVGNTVQSQDAPIERSCPEGVDPDKWKRCVDEVSSKGSSYNAYAVCMAVLTRSDEPAIPKAANDEKLPNEIPEVNSKVTTMTIQKEDNVVAVRMAEDLIRITSGLSPEASKLFNETYESSAASGHKTALRNAWNSVNKLWSLTSAGWQKRDILDGDSVSVTGDDDDDSDVDYPCWQCNLVQPSCCCCNCGTLGPGCVCIKCCAPLRQTCPGCKMPWSPIVMEELNEQINGGTMRTMPGELVEFRAFPDRGEILGWANSEQEDAHKTVISPEEVLRRVMQDGPKMDEEHNFKAVDGVEFVEFHPAKKLVRDKDGNEKLMDGISFTARCNLAIDAARSLYEKFKDGTYRGFSIAFGMPEMLKQKIMSGATNLIDKIDELPFISAVRSPSNAQALLLEMRSKQVLGDNQKPLPSHIVKEDKQIDRLELLRKEAESLSVKEDAASSKADPAPDSTSAAVAKSAVDDSLKRKIEELETRVADLIRVVASVSNPPSQTSLLSELQESWKTIAAKVSEHDKMAGALQSDFNGVKQEVKDLGVNLGGSTRKIDKAIEIMNNVLKTITDHRTAINKEIEMLKTPVKRKGIVDLAETRTAIHIRDLEKLSEKEKEFEQIQREAEQLLPPRR